MNKMRLFGGGNLVVAFIVNSYFVFSSSGSYLTKGLAILYCLLSIGCFSLLFEKTKTITLGFLVTGLITFSLALITCAVVDLAMNASLFAQVMCSMPIIIVGGVFALFKAYRLKDRNSS